MQQCIVKTSRPVPYFIELVHFSLLVLRRRWNGHLPEAWTFTITHHVGPVGYLSQGQHLVVCVNEPKQVAGAGKESRQLEA